VKCAPAAADSSVAVLHRRLGHLALLLLRACGVRVPPLCPSDADRVAADEPTAAPAVLPIDLAARLFGARPSASAPDLSPEGDKIVYIQAGVGPASVVRLLDLKTKQNTDIIASSGKPDSIVSCEFASEDWIVCEDVGEVPFQSSIVGSSRLVAINLVTKQVRNLGADYEVLGAATIKQNDGYVISYAAAGPPSVVMGRYYVLRSGQEGTMGSHGPPISLGVDRVALDTMKQIESQLIKRHYKGFINK